MINNMKPSKSKKHLTSKEFLEVADKVKKKGKLAPYLGNIEILIDPPAKHRVQNSAQKDPE